MSHDNLLLYFPSTTFKLGMPTFSMPPESTQTPTPGESITSMNALAGHFIQRRSPPSVTTRYGLPHYAYMIRRTCLFSLCIPYPQWEIPRIESVRFCLARRRPTMLGSILAYGLFPALLYLILLCPVLIPHMYLFSFNQKIFYVPILEITKSNFN